MQVKPALKKPFVSPFDLVHVVSIRRGSSATMINVLSAPLFKAEILDTISGVVYPKILHLGERLLKKMDGITLEDRRILCISLSAIWKIT